MIDSLAFSHLRYVVSDSLKLPAFVIALESIQGENPILFIFGNHRTARHIRDLLFGVLSLLARHRRRPHSRELSSEQREKPQTLVENKLLCCAC